MADSEWLASLAHADTFTLEHRPRLSTATWCKTDDDVIEAVATTCDVCLTGRQRSG